MTTINQDEINNIVWKACDTFRGVVDPSEYKNYILVFLFIKYISDVWKDKYEELKKELSQVLNYELKNPNVTGMLSVTKVKITPDFKYAKVYVSFLKEPTKNIEKLNKVKGFVRKALASRIKLRRTPEISFILDDSFFKMEKLDNLLNKDKVELEEMKKNNN